MDRRRQSKHRLGAAAVEFSLVAVPFLMMVFAVIEFGQMMMVRDIMTEVSRDAARIVSVNTNVKGGDDNDLLETEIINEVMQMMNGLPVEDVKIDVKNADAKTFDLKSKSEQDWKVNGVLQHRLVVTVSGRYKAMTPLPAFVDNRLDESMTISATTMIHSEGH